MDDQSPVAPLAVPCGGCEAGAGPAPEALVSQQHWPPGGRCHRGRAGHPDRA